MKKISIITLAVLLGGLSLNLAYGEKDKGDGGRLLIGKVLDHEDNRAVLARQATERLPVSRTYLPTLFVNIVGERTA